MGRNSELLPSNICHLFLKKNFSNKISKLLGTLVFSCKLQIQINIIEENVLNRLSHINKGFPSNSIPNLYSCSNSRESFIRRTELYNQSFLS